ncbi:MAG: hypothetical protein HC895_25300 [Leptolyngbyaceae cyanobacterium SM1_3_5]|nr:hypothetical protein [Leptolyngbyaceae cyanobacterium SM1_3_5]
MAVSGVCPSCGACSLRVQSRYWRQVGDLPMAGRRVVLRVMVRRFWRMNKVTKSYRSCTHSKLTLFHLADFSRQLWQIYEELLDSIACHPPFC